VTARRSKKRGAVVLAVAAWLLPAAAGARPKLTEDVSRDYWVGHGTATGALAVASVLTGALIDLRPERVRTSPKPVALSLSEGAQMLTLIAPPVSWVGPDSTSEFVDASLTYGEGVFLAMTVNHTLRLGSHDSSSTVAFAAAYIGSAMLDRQHGGFTAGHRSVDVRVRDAFWGFELGLATFSAHLEVRSGRRCYGSAVLGAGLGTVIGMGVMALHVEEKEFYRGHGLAPAKHWQYGLLGALPGLVVPLFFRYPTEDPLIGGLSDVRVSTLWLSEATKGVALSGRF
jgi:hypothetical protein